MELEGVHLIGNTRIRSGYNKYYAHNPKNDKEIGPAYTNATENDVNRAVMLAKQSFQSFKKKSGFERASFLRTIGKEINHLGNELINCCHEETALNIKKIIFFT